MTFDMKGCMEDQMKGIKEELTGSYLRMTSLNFQNKLPFNGLVKKSANIDKIGQCLTSISNALV